MAEYGGKQRNQLSRAAANSVAEKKKNVKQGFGFVDNRAITLAKRKLQERAHKSVQATYATQLQFMRQKSLRQLSVPFKRATFTDSTPIQMLTRVQRVHLITKRNGENQYMGINGAAGADPNDLTVGITQALGTDGWGGVARSPENKFHRAHALAKALGGQGDNTNVAWWTDRDEQEWTVRDEQVQGRHLNGFDDYYRPSASEEGDYEITSNQSQLDIKPNYRRELDRVVRIINNSTLNFVGVAATANVENQAGINWDTIRNVVRGAFYAIANGRINNWLDYVFTNTAGGVWKWDSISLNYIRTVHTGGGRGRNRTSNIQYTQTPAVLNPAAFGLQPGNLPAIWGLLRDANHGVYSRGNNPFKGLNRISMVYDNAGDEIGRFKFTIGDFHQFNVDFAP